MKLNDETADNKREVPLEPRVAKLEVGLDRLTADVRDLASVVRLQGSQVEQEIQKLVVAVTQASGPRKTDWPTVISAILLIMAIGSAVFWPLNQTANNNKAEIELLAQKFESHQALKSHPVGESLIMRLEDRVVNMENRIIRQDSMDLEELRMWRNKAIGLSIASPAKNVPDLLK